MLEDTLVVSLEALMLIWTLCCWLCDYMISSVMLIESILMYVLLRVVNNLCLIVEVFFC